MQTLHIYGDDTDVQNVLRYINELSTKGSEIEIFKAIRDEKKLNTNHL
jgi:hypothetical protein